MLRPNRRPGGLPRSVIPRSALRRPSTLLRRRQLSPRPLIHPRTKLVGCEDSTSVLTFRDSLLYLVLEAEVTTRISNPTCSPVARPSYRCGTQRAAASLFVTRLAIKPSLSLHNGSWDMEGTSP